MSRLYLSLALLLSMLTARAADGANAMLLQGPSSQPTHVIIINYFTYNS